MTEEVDRLLGQNDLEVKKGGVGCRDEAMSLTTGGESLQNHQAVATGCHHSTDALRPARLFATETCKREVEFGIRSLLLAVL